jgi:hypothetical protein
LSVAQPSNPRDRKRNIVVMLSVSELSIGITKAEGSLSFEASACFDKLII